MTQFIGYLLTAWAFFVLGFIFASILSARRVQAALDLVEFYKDKEKKEKEKDDEFNAGSFSSYLIEQEGGN